jgi:ribosomal protein L16 Arg81 hydroxylase
MTWKLLSDWVGDVPEFFANHWRSAPAVFRPGDRLSSLISLPDVDSAIDSGLLRTPYLEMVRKSTPIVEGDYTTARPVNGVVAEGFAEAGGIRRLLDDGVTLLLRNVEHWHAATRELTALLEQDLELRVETFLFVTPPGEQGLPVHRDDADVLLLQINGSKHWKVYAGPGDANWSPGRAGNVGPALLDETVHEGEVLYIPRGFAHEAISEQSLSVHLSFTIREVSVSELYAALQRLLLDGLPLSRRPLTEDDLLDDAQGLLDRFRVGLSKITAPEVLADARRAKLETLERSVSSLAGLVPAPKLVP